MRKKQEKKTWYPLDNAGVLYSALQKERYSAVYRFSAVMTQTVDPLALQRAVQKTMPRFPTFGVRIRRGAFWCYFEPNPNPGPFVKKDMANPCQPIRFHEDNDWLIRIFYYEKRISLEVFHAISDGAGSIIFLRTLLAVYLRERGYDIPNGPGILDVNEPPRKEEREDAYGRYGATITEYLTAVLLKSLIENQAAKKFRHPQPVALAIPINLRPWFPSETLRNFILTMRPVVDPSLGEYSLEEIVSLVHHSMRLHANRQEMRAKLTGNVRFTKNKFLQIVPLVLKNPVMSFSYKLVGVRPYSGTYTNPGPFPVPLEMEPHIQHMEVMLGQATRPSPHCASISYGNIMAITFAGTGVSSETERRFFTHLVREGIHVKVESNRTY